MRISEVFFNKFKELCSEKIIFRCLMIWNCHIIKWPKSY